MVILSYGFKKPQTGDFGDVWFPAMEFNIQRLNDHSHNGTDSAKINSSSLVASVVSVSSGSFASQGDGYYRATVNTPNAAAANTFVATVRDPTTKETIHMKTAIASATSIYIYTNTVQNVEVVFGV